MSCAGIPSVMHAAKPIFDAYASSKASAANGGGTNITLCVAPVAATAPATVSKTGTAPSRTFVPPLPGVTPPTIFVPYATIRCVWNRPSRPGDALDDHTGIRA